jgi:hypothetical protein
MADCYENIDMGFGVSAPFGVELRTTVIFSCMGIAFLNKTSKICGLYHYPAKAIRDPAVIGTILSMANSIKPDAIHLTPAKGSTGIMAEGSSQQDIDAVVAELRKAGYVQPVIEARNSSASICWEGSQPRMNQPTRASSPQDISTLVKRLEGQNNTPDGLEQARTIAGNVRLHGHTPEQDYARGESFLDMKFI